MLLMLQWLLAKAFRCVHESPDSCKRDRRAKVFPALGIDLDCGNPGPHAPVARVAPGISKNYVATCGNMCQQVWPTLGISFVLKTATSPAFQLLAQLPRILERLAQKTRQSLRRSCPAWWRLEKQVEWSGCKLRRSEKRFSVH